MNNITEGTDWEHPLIKEIMQLRKENEFNKTNSGTKQS